MNPRIYILIIAGIVAMLSLARATLAQESIYLPMIASDSATQTAPTATSEATATPIATTIATTLRTFTTGVAQNIYAGDVTIECPNSRINRPGNYGELTDDDGNVWMVPAPVAGGFTNVDVYNDCTGTGENDYAAELTTQTIDENGSEITAYLFADNYYEFYVNGTYAGRDSVPFIPFDSKATRFQAEYPITYAALLVDWEEYNGIGLENGLDGVSIGDGGFIAAFSDGTTTNADWVCKPFYIAPLDNNSCVVIDANGNADSSACNSTNETVSCVANDPENSCMAYLEELPANWMASDYDDSGWLAATTYTADDVTGSGAFRDYEETLFAGADFIWSKNLRLDNAVVCRATIEDPNAATTPTPASTSAPTSTATPTPTSTGTATVPDPSLPDPSLADSWLASWLVNSNGETSATFSGSTVNVSSVTTATVDGELYQYIEASGIPNYATSMTQEIIDGLNNRPLAANDFGSGMTTATVGQTINFGESIGYNAFGPCTEGDEGYGYWPPGLQCPEQQQKQQYFPLNPEPATEVCETNLNSIGTFVNGVSIFNFQDGFSYNNEGVWVNEAFHFEIYDLDVCVGHSANGEYHHHSSSLCLAEQLNDEGTEHSPIYGFAADGYPIYGPWHNDGILAESCWMTRDYDDANSNTGCGVAGERSCLLVDQYDISQGTTPADSNGPTTSDTVMSLSSNPFVTTSGYYFQDYYYDATCTAQGAEYLDEHNGHEHDGLGYHYHVTVEQETDGSLTNVFPFYVGPRYAGVLHDNALASCNGGGGGGPGGGGPPPDGGGPGGGGPPPNDGQLTTSGGQRTTSDGQLTFSVGERK